MRVMTGDGEAAMMMAVCIFQFCFDYHGELAIQLRRGFYIKPVGCNLFVGRLRIVPLSTWVRGATFFVS